MLRDNGGSVTRHRNAGLNLSQVDNKADMYYRFGTESVPQEAVITKFPKSRIWVGLCLVFGVCVLGLVVALAVVLSGRKPHDGPREEEVCLTEGCVIAAARVAGAMDTSVKPCDDFYQFACGTWIRKHVIPEDKGSFGTFTQLRDDVSITLKSLMEDNGDPSDPEAVIKARDYYKACLNETAITDLGLTYILQYSESFGGLPALGSNPGGNWDASSFNLEDLMVRTMMGTTYIPFVDLGVMQDDKNPSQHILYVDQQGLGLPSRDYYLKGRDDETLMAYQTMLKEIFVALGGDEAVADSDVKDLVDMEIELANITIPKEERRDAVKLYNLMTVGDLAKNFTGFNYGTLLRGMMNVVGETVDDNEPIVAVAPEYLKKVFTVVSKYSNRTLANYIVMNRLTGKTFFLPQNFRDIKLKFDKVLSGTASVAPRWQSCANTVKSSMPDTVGRLFVIEAFKKDAKADVLDLVGKLKLSFKEMIDALPWMEDVTKNIAKEKADAVEARIGYPEKVYNDTYLNDRNKEMKIYANDPLRSLVSIGEAGVKRSLERLRKPVDRTEWGMSPATVNAYYDPENNQISFPAAILQPPFYAKDQPSYLNYGGIGYVIGHEITHGFDDQGRLYDKTGKLNNWWTSADTDRFKQRAQCIIDQYSNFTVPGTGGMHLNGINTQGENIADNGGIKESFKAYRKWVAGRGKEEAKLPGLDYTPDQLYFLNAAQVWCDKMRDHAKVERILTDPHSIDRYRVYGPMQNFDEFTKAWNCPAGSFMNPTNKCAVW